MKRAMLAAAAILAISAHAGCGGKSGANNVQNYGGLNPTVTVSPATANVQPGSTQQFVAAVTNSLHDTVTWEVNGVVGGNTTFGTVDINGIYTAPLLTPAPAQATITAVLNAATSFSGNSIVTVTSVVFNNSSLKGNYVLSLRGTGANASSSFYAAGVITADGNGNITGGAEDMNDTNSGYTRAATVTGTYSIGADGRGTLNLNSSLGSFAYAIAIRADGNAGLNEADKVVVNATGTLEAQAANVSAPSGSYAFGFSGASSACGSMNSIGLFGMDNGAVSGMQDLNCGGMVTQSQVLSGSYGTIDALGRGTGSFFSGMGASDFIYYMVSANRYRFLSSDSRTGLLGSADLQAEASFADSDFNGLYVISSSATSQTTISNMLIEIDPLGGNIPTGFIDVNNTGAVSNSNVTGAYSLGPSGYVTGTFNAILNTLQTSFPFSMYLVSSGQAYYLDLRTQIQGRTDIEGVTGGGLVYAQTETALDNLAWAGSYTTRQAGHFTAGGALSTGNSTTVSGQISANGNGVLAGTLDFNDPSGVSSGLQAQGSYSVGLTVPGRTTVKIITPNGTRNYAAYIVSPRQVQLLETDSSITERGDAILQF